jgi:hypothetical protein
VGVEVPNLLYLDVAQAAEVEEEVSNNRLPLGSVAEVIA